MTQLTMPSRRVVCIACFAAFMPLGTQASASAGGYRAVTLACGAEAVISHRSAGALLGLLDKGPVVIDVIARGDRGRHIDGIRFHRVRSPRRDEVGTVAGIPCTSPARTLVDLAGTVGDWTLRSCFERAAQKKALDIPAIEASMDPGRRGNRSLRALIDEWRGAAPIAKKGRLKSPLEAKVLPLLVQRAPPRPAPQCPGRDRQGPHRGRLPLARSPFRPRGRQPRLPRHPDRLRARPLARPRTAAGRLHDPPRHAPPGRNRSRRHRRRPSPPASTKAAPRVRSRIRPPT